MIKNFNDFLSIITILAVAAFAIKIFFGSLFAVDTKKMNISRRYLLKHYIENEDE